jgi:hypothetical protein
MQLSPDLMVKQLKNAPWLSMKPGPGPRAAAAAVEVVDTAVVADTVAVGIAAAVVDMVVAVVDTVTSVVVAEMAEEEAADAKINL